MAEQGKGASPGSANGGRRKRNGGASKRKRGITQGTEGKARRDRYIAGSGKFFCKAPEEVAKRERIAHITANREKWPVKRMCKVLKVSEACYYKAKRRQPAAGRHDALLAEIREILQADIENANYGIHRLYLALKRQKEYQGSYSTVRSVCRENGLVLRRKSGAKGITRADAAAQKAENLIQQDFTASAPGKKSLMDITMVSCIDGNLYVAGILDCFDGQLIGYAMADHMRAELCVEALDHAWAKGYVRRGMIAHSDRGSQYTSRVFRETLSTYGAVQSMSGTGRCYDNARMESFWATLKKEKLYKLDTRRMTMAEVKSVIYRYICYYNQRRVYTPNGGYPPEVFRARYELARQAA